MKVIGPARTRSDTNVKALFSAGANMRNIPLRFTSSKMTMYSNIR